MEVRKGQGEVLSHWYLSVSLGKEVTGWEVDPLEAYLKVWEVDRSFWESTWSITTSKLIQPQGNEAALSCLGDLHSFCAFTQPLSKAMWPQQPRGPWPCNSKCRLQEGAWNGLQLETHAKLAGCWTGLDWTPIWSLDFGQCGLPPGATEDKAGHFPWWHRQRWDTGKSGGEALSFYIIKKLYHGAGSCGGGLRKLFSFR